MAWPQLSRSNAHLASAEAEAELQGGPWLSARRRAILICLLSGLLAALPAVIPQLFDWQENVDLFLLFHARGRQLPSPDVVIVPIDRRVAQSIGVSRDPEARAECVGLLFIADLPVSHEHLRPPHLLSQWPRCLMGRAVQSLHSAGASVIVLDVLFRARVPTTRNDDERNTESDRKLAAIIRAAGNVLLAERIEGESDAPAVIAPVIADAAMGQAPFLLSRSNMTFIHRFFTLERNAWDNVSMPLLALQVHTLPQYSVLREILVAEEPELAAQLPASTADVWSERHIQTLALILRAALKKNPALAERVSDALDRPEHADMTPVQRKQLRALIHAYTGNSERYFNFHGPPGTMQAVRFEKLVAGTDLPDLTGKVAFVGLAEYGHPEQYEHFPTIWSDRAGFDHGGVELAATAYSNLVEGDSIRPMPGYARGLLIFMLSSFFAWICFFYTSSRAILISIAACSLYLAIALILFESAALWLPVLASGFGVTSALIVAFTTQYVELKHQYRGLHKVLGMFVPRGVVERLVNNAERLAWIRDSAFGACVATDGERYTALADQLTPVELSRFLNRYFQTLFPPVASRQGWVSDVVGDSMLAVWAEARPNPRVREQACQAALEMLSASQRFATKMPTRIGVDFGPIALSTLGAGTHWEYRPVGAVPNTANRLQALNKRLGTKLLVSEAVVEGLNGFVARDLGWFLLRGKESPTRVYELISEREHASDEQVGLCAAFASALERFQAGDLAVAGLQFDALQAQHDDGPARFFALLCRQHAAHVGGVVVIND